MVRAVLLCLLAWLAGTAAAQEPPRWRLVPEESAVEWTVEAAGETVTGGFEDFTADIRFDPANPETGKIRVEVDTRSIYVEGEDARETLINENWFAAKQHPKAVFEAETIRRRGGDYIAHGNLTIRDDTDSVKLAFTLDVEDATARASGTAEIDRRAFGVGRGGQFANAPADTVTLEIAVTARRAGG